MFDGAMLANMSDNRLHSAARSSPQFSMASPQQISAHAARSPDHDNSQRSKTPRLPEIHKQPTVSTARAEAEIAKRLDDLHFGVQSTTMIGRSAVCPTRLPAAPRDRLVCQQRR
jgi:hypothetical protein